VSAYENFAWAGSKIEFPDVETVGARAVLRSAQGRSRDENPAIDGLITRADGQTIAIEHTLIEPFVGDRGDYAMFDEALLKIERDTSLAVPDTDITIYIPVGILDGQKPAQRKIVESIHSWIANNRLVLYEGEHKYQCDVPGMPPVTLTVKRRKRELSRPNAGRVLVRRQQVVNDLDKVIEKALRRKLPKLVNTKADRHVLFLERDQFTFHPELIFAEIERQHPNFPELEKVDEIWEVETVGYAQDGCLTFALWKGDQVLVTMGFKGGELLWN
jgi:hypothetical protein